MTPTQEALAGDLMRRAQEGDEAAYVELLVLLTREARRYVRGKLRSEALFVDDVVQETLVSVHRARHTWHGQRAFAPWFFAIVHSRLIDAIRRQQRRSAREVGVDVLPDRPPPAGRDSPVDIEAVRRALAALPPRQREVVEAIKLRDESTRDIAGRLGMSVPAVKVTAHRGYLALRRMLGVTRDQG